MIREQMIFALRRIERRRLASMSSGSAEILVCQARRHPDYEEV
jgi:hypothetical protein